jgi:hypothetical protein
MPIRDIVDKIVFAYNGAAFAQDIGQTFTPAPAFVVASGLMGKAAYTPKQLRF